jgi:hypothetical protein
MNLNLWQSAATQATSLAPSLVIGFNGFSRSPQYYQLGRP